MPYEIFLSVSFVENRMIPRFTRNFLHLLYRKSPEIMVFSDKFFFFTDPERPLVRVELHTRQSTIRLFQKDERSESQEFGTQNIYSP